MSATNSQTDAGGAGTWPSLAFDDWKDTCETLQLWTQVVGKIRLKLARPQQAQQATSALATTDAFLRAEAHCAGCGGLKKVTWAK